MEGFLPMRKTSSFVAVVIASTALAAFAQVKERPIPRIVKKDGRYALFVDDAPYFLLAAQVNNSSGWPAMLPQVWPAMEFLHANTVEIPVYWEQFEPRQGQFDYSLVDTLLTQARAHQMRLLLLWFGTWKNGNPHYVPEWMKLDPERYPYVVDKSGHPADSPSPFAAASLEADTRAFAALMRHLRTADPQRTVLMVQVENEPGTGGNLRDYSPPAQKLFDGPVPADVLKAMQVPPGASSPNWQEVFGPDADVCFHNWAVAKYIGQVAAAGKAAYSLPLYVNAAPGTHRCAVWRGGDVWAGPRGAGAAQLQRRWPERQQPSHLESRRARARHDFARRLCQRRRRLHQDAGNLWPERQPAFYSRDRRQSAVFLPRVGPSGDRLFALRAGLHED